MQHEPMPKFPRSKRAQHAALMSEQAFACTKEFPDRVLILWAFAAMKIAIVAAHNRRYREGSYDSPKRLSWSRKLESAVGAFITFAIEENGYEIFALDEEALKRGAGKFRVSTYHDAIRQLENFNLVSTWRDTSDKYATNKRRRIPSFRHAKAILSTLPKDFVDYAAYLISDSAFCRTASESYESLCDRAANILMPDDLDPIGVWRMIDDCEHVERYCPGRAIPRLTQNPIPSDRQTKMGYIHGWDHDGLHFNDELPSVSDDSAPPIDTHNPPAFGQEQIYSQEVVNLKEATLGSQSSQSDLELTADGEGQIKQGSGAGGCAPECSEGTPMATLTGNGPITKAEQIAQEAERRQGRKAQRGAATKGRLLDQAPSRIEQEVMKDATLATIRLKAKQDGLDMAKVEKFCDRVQGYDYKTFKTGKVAAWFAEAEGGMQPDRTTKAEEIDDKAIWRELCGNADRDDWIGRMGSAGLTQHVNGAMLSASRMSAFYHENRDRKESFSEVARIGHILGTCAYLFDIAEVNGDTLGVLHPAWFDRDASVGLATQAHADLVAKIISAITGKAFKGEPWGFQIARMSERKCSP